MSRSRSILAAAALAALPLAARAESPRYGSLELGAGKYTPNVDAQGGLSSPLPYDHTFGGGGWMFRLGISRALLTHPGALEVGFRTGFFRVSANTFAIDPNTGAILDTRTGDTTSFNIIPTSLTLGYRLDVLADRWGIPFAPYARVALERYNWWVTGGSGGTSKTGATNGWSATGGIAFLLDFLDPPLAREFDLESGVNHTYLFLDVTKTKVDDFGSSNSWDLSADKVSLAFGMMFVF